MKGRFGQKKAMTFSNVTKHQVTKKMEDVILNCRGGFE